MRRFGFAIAAMVLAIAPTLALDGQPAMHDPSTVIEAGGKFYVYATGNGLPVFQSDDGWTWHRALVIHPPRRVGPEDRETPAPRGQAGQHRDQRRGLGDDLPRRLVLSAVDARVVLRWRQLELQHPHGLRQKGDRPIPRQHGHRHAQGGGKLFAGSSGRHIGVGHFGLLDLGDGVLKVSCHYESDLSIAAGSASSTSVRCCGATAGRWRETT
jgi:hypothetical protein